jgi:hypothetical protein
MENKRNLPPHLHIFSVMGQCPALDRPIVWWVNVCIGLIDRLMGLCLRCIDGSSNGSMSVLHRSIRWSINVCLAWINATQSGVGSIDPLMGQCLALDWLIA